VRDRIRRSVRSGQRRSSLLAATERASVVSSNT
jgi:hypothetical protein